MTEAPDDEGCHPAPDDEGRNPAQRTDEARNPAQRTDKGRNPARPPTDEGRRLAQPNAAFLGDRGEADPVVRALIADAGTDLPASYLRAVAALCGTRLLLPVVAAGQDSLQGPDPDRLAELAAVSVEAPDGRRALLAFTGIDALVDWEPRARPVPATLDDIAATALETGDVALLVDVAGPVPFVIGDDLIAQLAQGRRLVELDDGGFGWAYLDPTA